jgi:molybdopterin-guanine dinucleotide biosynthesis protein A
MGRDKAWLPVGGLPLLARQIEIVKQLAPRELFISGRAGVDYSQFNCPVLHDRLPDQGPLGGIHRALQESAAPLLFVLAVDMPRMEAAFAQQLASKCDSSMGAVPKVNGQIEPLAAFYPKAALAIAERLLGGKRRAAIAFAENCAAAGLVHILDMSASDAVYFTNWNAPQDTTIND